MPTVLVTGFEPFAGAQINPSAELVKRLEAAPPPGVTLYTAILPVDAEAAPPLLTNQLRELQPDWCLMFGLADGRMALSIERVGVNLCDFRIPDNSGQQRQDQPIATDGPAAYFATVPVRALLTATHAAGVPAELSLSAGAYLCNMVLYTALHVAAQGLNTRCGFIHVPALPEQTIADHQRRPTMTLDLIERGARAMLVVLGGQEASAR